MSSGYDGVAVPARACPDRSGNGAGWRDAFYVLSPVPNLLRGTSWQRQSEPYFQRIFAALEARLMPGLRDAIVTCTAMTPPDFSDTLRSVDGAAFGPEPVLSQSAWFRYHNRSPDVGGLYFVGVGTHAGGGLPGVLSSARVLDRVVPEPVAR